LSYFQPGPKQVFIIHDLKEEIMKVVRNKNFLGLCFIFTSMFIFSVQTIFGAELTPAMKTALDWIDGAKSDYVGIAKYIWENPELSLVEFKSSAKLQEYLARNGFKIEKGVAGMSTAFVATWGSGKPVIGIMGEFDALPGLSQESGNTLQKPIIPGAPGHGCGHNLFGTSSATAAIAAAKAMEKHGIKGTVKFFGSPAEETLIGKIFMNRDGVFDGTDIMIAWHPGEFNGAFYGTNLAIDNIKFRFYGKSSHAGTAPEAGRSALDAVQLMNMAMEFMREHVTQEARIHYVITKGGDTPNNVPAFSEVWYYVRAPRRSQVDGIRSWMLDIARSAATMTQTRMEHQILTASYERLPNRALSVRGDEIAKAIGAPPFTQEDQKFGEEVIKNALKKEVKGEAFSTKVDTPNFNKVFPDIEGSKASADVNYTWKFPSLWFSAATQVKGTPGHSWPLVCQSGTPVSMKAGLQVSKYMAASIVELLNNQKLIEDAWAEHNKYIAEFGYKEPIPPEVKVPSFQDLYGINPEAVPGARK
jgi:aminobenzoyl-glutamate utilization protein B